MKRMHRMAWLTVSCSCLFSLIRASAQEPKLHATLEGHRDRVNSVAFSPDGKTLAAGSLDKSIALWHMPSGKKK